MSNSVRVYEAYRDWTPPGWVRPTLSQVLESVDRRYLIGLETIVLTNTRALNSQRKRGKIWSRRHKVKFVDCRALYYARRQGQGAWIEIFVDKVIERGQPWMFAIPLVRDLYIADTLFHELGHHIHHTQAPEFRNREDVADAWQKRLIQERFQSRHPLIRLAKRVVSGRGSLCTIWGV